MIRRFLTLRWVVIHLLTVAVVILFVVFLGRWQYHRWEGRGSSVVPPDNRPAVALADLDQPNQPLPGGSIGRQTTVTGRFDGAHQVLIAGKPLAGRSGYWIVTPLRPDGGSADAVALVVRGWVPNTDDPAMNVPDTRVTVSGRLYASEDPPPVSDDAPPPHLPAGQFRELNNGELTGVFPYRSLDGYVLLARTDPVLAGAPAVVPVPVTTEDSGGGVRNLIYAIQWWLFALAVLYFWWRLIRDDLKPPEERFYRRTEPETSGSAAADPETAGTASPALPEPVAAASPPREDDSDDAELAAYNRWLAELNARPDRSRSRTS